MNIKMEQVAKTDAQQHRGRGKEKLNVLQSLKVVVVVVVVEYVVVI